MARYTGPVCRICRRYGEKLFLKGEKCVTRCVLDRRSSPPGGGAARRRRKISDRGLQLREKQKARFTYGLMEKQFRRLYQQAVRQPGVTGENLVRNLEMRLDNVVYRMGFAESRAAARQTVRHGHIMLNGRKTDIPSARVKVGDVIAWTPSGQKTELFAYAKEAIKNRHIPRWLEVDQATLTGRVVAQPTLADADARFDPAVIVEYYSR